MYRLPMISIAGIHAHTLRNLLWKTSILPSKPVEENSEAPRICETLKLTQTGYIVLNDEEDGFRIFWIDFISPSGTDDVIVLDSSHSPRQQVQPKRRDIVTVIHDSSIEPRRTQIMTGCSSQEPHQDSVDELNIVFEGYLKVDALLSDIIRRRKKMIYANDSELCILPDYYYNLVSITNGRSANLVVVFNNPRFVESGTVERQKKVPAAYGICVTLDLFDHSYTETQWLQHPTCNGAVCLRQWSNKLAVTKRMAEMRVGPYSVSTSKEIFGIKTHEMDINDEDDTNVDIWEAFVNQEGSKRVEPPKAVAMSSLYPFCDVVNNDAVISAIPVHRISCRNFPLELYYS